MRDDLDADVVIIGGGPCGLVLAHELGRRKVRTILLNDRPGSLPHPRANATQARTMEHYRRLGIAKRVRAAGLPPDYKPDVAYVTRLAGHEMARIDQMAAAEVEKAVRQKSEVSNAAELPHRCPQMLTERILREEADKLPSVSLRFGWQATGFSEESDHVAVEAVAPSGEPVRLKAQYLFGADGPRSLVRRQLGVAYQGEQERDRPFLAGQMYSIYFNAPGLYELMPNRPAWQYWVVNPERRGMLLAIDGRRAFVYMTQLRPGEDPRGQAEDEARAILHQAVGQEFDLTILERYAWTAGLTLVAERFQHGRVFMGGDAVHLFTPTGGLGYNTSVDDAVNIGWKLAGVVNGWADPAILGTYEIERKPAAERNTDYARKLANSVGHLEVPAKLEEASSDGASERAKLGDYLAGHGRAEFNVTGISLGVRYDASSLTVGDGTQPPPDDPNRYQPSACPGGRTPHAWLSDGRSLYDALNFEYTLLRLGMDAQSSTHFLEAAQARSMPLIELDLSGEGLRPLYEADFAIVRPDQVICWRGDALPAGSDTLLDRLSGVVPPGVAAAQAGSVAGPP